ncbi:MAG: hypothetical protein IT428_03900 [Planctomycetaceae bacterium]|nr:hypothetical protein [Planctomycetaceae bacterium]
MKRPPVDFDQNMMSLAAETASRSSDPFYQNGAVVVVGNRWRSAWNQSADPLIDNIDALSLIPPGEQGKVMEWAERAVLACCARHGMATDGGTLYTLWGSTYETARLIAIAGIARVVLWKSAINTFPESMRKESRDGIRAMQGFGVVVDLYDGPLLCSVSALRCWDTPLFLNPDRRTTNTMNGFGRKSADGKPGK